MNNGATNISLNNQWKYFVQDDNPPPVGAYQSSYQPFGDLNLKFKDVEAASNYRRESNLENAISATSYTVNGVDYKKEYFVSQPNQAIIINLSASQKSSISFEAELSS